MPVSKSGIQVQWSAANSVSVSAGGNSTSDAFDLGNNCVQADISLKADNNGTAASGDVVRVWLLRTCGDPDGTGADEYDTVAHRQHLLALLDTNAGDPGRITVAFDSTAAKSYKLYAENAASGNAITVSATVYAQTVT